MRQPVRFRKPCVVCEMASVTDLDKEMCADCIALTSMSRAQSRSRTPVHN